MTQPANSSVFDVRHLRGNIRDVTSTQYLTASKSTVAGTVFHCKYLIRRNRLEACFASDKKQKNNYFIQIYECGKRS